jgi:hypothetical protein
MSITSEHPRPPAARRAKTPDENKAARPRRDTTKAAVAVRPPTTTRPTSPSSPSSPPPSSPPPSSPPPSSPPPSSPAASGPPPLIRAVRTARRAGTTLVRRHHRLDITLTGRMPDGPVLFVTNHGFGGAVDLNVLAALAAFDELSLTRDVTILCHQMAWTLGFGKIVEAGGCLYGFVKRRWRSGWARRWPGAGRGRGRGAWRR